MGRNRLDGGYGRPGTRTRGSRFEVFEGTVKVSWPAEYDSTPAPKVEQPGEEYGYVGVFHGHIPFRRKYFGGNMPLLWRRYD